MDNHSKYGRFCNQVYLWFEIRKFYSRLIIRRLTKKQSIPSFVKAMLLCR